MPLTKEEYKLIGGYPSVDPHFQFLQLRDLKLGTKGLLKVFLDLEEDNILKHVDFSGNISRQEASIPGRLTLFISKLAQVLRHNKCLTAIDVCDNNLFYFTPHPCNEHVVDYLKAFTDAIIPSEITHLDISNNYMVGPRRGTIYTGLRYLMRNFVHPQGLVLKARHSMLHSYCCQLIAEGIGTGSQLEELDICDNCIGLDPNNAPASDGVVCLCANLMNTLSMRVLRLARNHIMDDDVATIANAAAFLPSLQILDLSGNHCSYFGARALKYLIMAHGSLDNKTQKQGLEELYLSQNPLGSLGIDEISQAVGETFTLQRLGLAECEVDRVSMGVLSAALQNNSTITVLDVSNNRVTPYVESVAQMESEAVKVLNNLRINPLAIDANKLNKVLYLATARKLRFLPPETLFKLHSNPSFNIPSTPMKDSLHVLMPPLRTKQVKDITSESAALPARLVLSREVSRRMAASRKIFHAVMPWMREIQAEKAFEKQMEALRKAKEQKDLENDEASLASTH